METTLFYVFGIALVAAALVVSFLGLRSETFPSRAALRLGIAVFAVLVGVTATFSVLNARDEQHKRNEELAAHAEEEKAAREPGKVAEQPGGKAPTGPGATLKLVADETQIAWDPTKLVSKPGKVRIDLDNPSPIQHDVVIVKDGTEIAKSDLVTSGTTSVSAELAPGAYTYLCDVPGHEEAGMTGTLTVK